MGDDEHDEVHHRWWRPWAIALAGATVVTLSIGLIVGAGAAFLGTEVNWLTVLGVCALVLAFELPLMVVLALFGRFVLRMVKDAADRNDREIRSLFERDA